MRSTRNLLAVVKSGRYLTPGNPTGLTGLFTHPNPRPQLMYLYSNTLSKLSSFPESSVYRQSCEALTKHRLAVLESTKPPGYDEWLSRAQKLIQENPDTFQIRDGETKGEAGIPWRFLLRFTVATNQLAGEWDGEPQQIGVEEQKRRYEGLGDELREQGKDLQGLGWEGEPSLEAAQIGEIENKIGGGLIEEVIEVAERESELVDIMREAKVWESLQENTPPGQWEYFGRDQHTPGTQAPPTKLH
ncbi:hypothetical protein MMC25_006807 [Agyrium rufum]|nr:hypothetical protein [Agyrium rufum]